MMWSLPRPELLDLQAEWLAEARARILRLAEIGRRRRILDLGCGSGATVQDLKRRSSGFVVALDLKLEPLQHLKNVDAVQGEAPNLPFANQTFDLIYSQNVLLWIPRVNTVVEQVYRLLKPGGVLISIEPDYGGLIEYPEAIESQFLWINGLLRAGADPFIGRKLPALFEKHKWNLRTELLPRICVPNLNRFRFLEDLPLTLDELGSLRQIKNDAAQIPSESQVVHLPYFLILAERRE